MSPGGMPPDSDERLFHRLTDLTVGEGTALVIGDAGTGKTHRLRHLASRVRAIEGVSGWCLCSESLGGPPLWELVAAISEIDPALPSDFPGTNDLEISQRIWRWLEEQGRRAPTLIVLDDLHEASESTIALFNRLGRRPRTSAWLVVGGARGIEADVRQVEAPRVHVRGIDERGIMDLASSMGVDISPPRARELAEFTGANPLFVRHLLEAGATDLSVPTRLSALVERALDDIGGELQPALEALSVLGLQARRSLVAAVVGKPLPPIDPVAVRQVLTVNDEDLLFRHPLMREVTYERLSDQRRAELHALAAHAIDLAGGSPSQVAEHWERASFAAQGVMAAETALRAGHLALEVGAWGDATRHFSHASVVLAQLDDADALAESAVYRARALSLAGRTAEALRCIADLTDPDRLAIGTRRLGMRELTRLRWREEPNASVLDGSELRRLVHRWLGDTDDPASIAAAIGVRVVAHEIDAADDAVLEDAVRACAALRSDPDAEPVEIGEAHLALRRAQMRRGVSIEERLASTESAVAAASLATDRELLGRSIRMRLVDVLCAGDRSLTISTLQSFDTAATAGLREHQALAVASVATLEGRYADAVEVLELAAKELSFIMREAPSLEFVRALISLDQGGFAEALGTYEPMLTVIADATLQSCFAYTAALAGEWRRTGDLIDQTLTTLADNPDYPLANVSLAMAADAAVIIGHERCQELYDALLPLRGTCVLPANAAVPWLGSNDRLLGLLAIELGHVERGIDFLASSLAQHEHMRAVPWMARSHHALAAAKAGHPSAAFHRSRADALAESIGMAPLAELHPQATPHAPAPSMGPDGTSSPRVLEQLADGWVLVGEDRTVLPRLVGFAYLAQLLASPGREWHVLDLTASTSGARIDQSDTGPALDAQARAAYQNRMSALTAELDEATDAADTARAAAARLEIEAIEEQVLAAFGLGGKARRTGDTAERARVNVRRNLARAIDAIEQVDPSLGDHLRDRVTTGRFCRYRPTDGGVSVQWVG